MTMQIVKMFYLETRYSILLSYFHRNHCETESETFIHIYQILKVLSHYVPPTEGGGHIVFGAVPVGVGVGVRVGVRVASFLRDIF